MFDPPPPEPAEMGRLDDAALIAAVEGWARSAAAAEACKYAAIAELERRRDTAEHPNWACDDWDAAAAEIAAALNIGHRRASGEMDIAVMLRDRFPKVGAMFLSGAVDARRVAVIADRTYLVQDSTALTELDAAIAERITDWGPLSEYKLTQAIDVWVDSVDPGALRRTRSNARSRDFKVSDPDEKAGTSAVWGRLLATDAALLNQRLAAMARDVCEDDPRTTAQRRADAVGALAAGSQHLRCMCDNPQCPAASDDGRASSVIVHVIAEEAATTGSPDPYLHGEDPVGDDSAEDTGRTKAALITGGGAVPAPLLADLIAHGARVRPVVAPDTAPEPRYRPSAALDEFVRVRDMTCRFPGCDRPAMTGDIDHTVPYPAGPTHAGGLKCYCRKHHLLKTFWPGWSDHQLADGTVVVTTPTGRAYATKPGASLFFPGWAIATPAPPPATPATPSAYRTVMMPTRKRARMEARADRIKAERALNDAHVAERNRPPPF
ncbi:DUF222 domain-containing protein [Mycolicibacterium sp. 624]|uniref:HNH endonuclease signature motif containing protein n=1 Tax=Mycolicibacterium sp. 624 TaxID=3156314 RepID=UPI0033943A89